jgi:cytochrome c-type biogenesis protein CcmH
VITFWVVAVALVVAVVVLLAVPLVRRPEAVEVVADQDRSNVALFQDQLSELERDREQGLLTDEQFEQARIELGQRLLADVPAQDTPAVPPARARGLPWRWAVLGCVPIAALLGYVVLGTPQAMDPRALAALQGGSQDQRVNLEHLAARLAERLEKEPDDTEAWVLLARSYQMLGRNAEAVKAFARAVQLVPNSAQLYADYADVQIGAADGQWTEGARAAVNRALEIDPAHPKAIWLAGTDAFMQKQYVEALRHWEKLPALVEPNSEAAQVVQNNIAEARKLAATQSPPAAGPAAAGPQSKPDGNQAAGAEVLRGTVDLAPGLRGDVKPTDAVFVFARAAEGPKMPLAIRKLTVQDLPYAFALDDAAAMAPGMTISSFDQVVIGARVSKSGDATARKGDLEGYSAPVKPGTSGIEVRIDARVE